MATVVRLGFRDHVCTNFVEGFIGRFITGNDVSRISKSVSIEQHMIRNEQPGYLPEVCESPPEQNVGTPKTRFFDDLLQAGHHEVEKCDLYVFANHAFSSELQLFATTVRSVRQAAEDDCDDFFVMTFTTQSLL